MAPSIKEIAELSEAKGTGTNNDAEYLALIRGLEVAKEFGATQVACMLDSELVVKQVNGEYAVKADNIKPLYLRVIELLISFKEGFSVDWIPRRQNQRADELSKLAISI